MPTLLYHFTHVDNLPGILAAGCLRCVHALGDGDAPVSVAHEGIQARRARTVVPCGPGGVLHDYVPFYFATRQPMLYAIQAGNVPSYQGRQTDLIYFVTAVEKVLANELPFVFTDGHPTMALSEFFADWSLRNQVDWPLMAQRFWGDTDDDNDRKRRRQAEFLIHRTFPLTAALGIAVNNEAMRQSVLELTQDTPYKDLRVRVRPGWYFQT